MRNAPWFAIAAMLLCTMPAHASVQEMRIVGVGIDSSSKQAEQKALDYAKARAVYLAIRKLSVPDPGTVAAKLKPAQWDLILRGATITNRRREGEITYLEVQVTVVDEALLRALKLPENYGKSPVTATKLRGVLLLPMLVGKEHAYLWEKENILRPLVSAEIRRQSQGGLLLPDGELEDLRLIDYQNALTVKPEELKPMFDRYGAEEIIIAVLTPGATGTKDSSNVLLRRLSHSEVKNELLEIPAESELENSATRLSKATSSIVGAVTQIASSTAQNERTARDHAKQIKVQFSYSTPRDLAKMQSAVQSAPQVLFLELPSIALAQVAGTIYLKGEANALRETLLKQNIFVTTIESGWRISVR